MTAKDVRRKALRRRHKPRRGRPRAHSESWSRVTVVLFDRQIARLDRLSANIRHETGKVVKRAALIRGVIDALFDSEVDVTSVESERELRIWLADHLRH
jgi:hypothetical protein